MITLPTAHILSQLILSSLICEALSFSNAFTTQEKINPTFITSPPFYFPLMLTDDETIEGAAAVVLVEKIGLRPGHTRSGPSVSFLFN